MKTKFKTIVVAFTLISALILSGCQTAKGFGEDMEQGGKAIQKAATDY